MPVGSAYLERSSSASGKILTLVSALSRRRLRVLLRLYLVEILGIDPDEKKGEEEYVPGELRPARPLERIVLARRLVLITGDLDDLLDLEGPLLRDIGLGDLVLGERVMRDPDILEILVVVLVLGKVKEGPDRRKVGLDPPGAETLVPEPLLVPPEEFDRYILDLERLGLEVLYELVDRILVRGSGRPLAPSFHICDLAPGVGDKVDPGTGARIALAGEILRQGARRIFVYLGPEFGYLGPETADIVIDLVEDKLVLDLALVADLFPRDVVLRTNIRGTPVESYPDLDVVRIVVPEVMLEDDRFEGNCHFPPFW